MRTPKIETIEMIRAFIKEHDRTYSIYQLWKKLPKKMMYQTYKAAISHLLKENEIVIEGNKKISCINKKPVEIKHISRNAIIYNLSYYGYDLISIKKIRKSRPIPMEDLIIEILTRHPEARFIEAIPTLMIKKKIDKFELYRKACDYGLINKIGFLLNISFIIAKRLKKDIVYLKELLNKLKAKKEKKIQYFSTIKDKKFLDRTTPKIMESWNLRGRFFVEDFYKEAYA